MTISTPFGSLIEPPHTPPEDMDGVLKRVGVVDDENEAVTWVEYWRGEDLIQRSAHVFTKKPPEAAQAIAAALA